MFAPVLAVDKGRVVVLQGPQDFPGSGLGSVNTLLTIQSPGSSSFEEGSVGRTVDGTSDVLTGDAMSGASQSLTRTIDEVRPAPIA